MKKTVFAIAAALAFTAAAPAMAQEPTKISVETTKIGELINNPAAKAALEKTLPQIAEYYDQIGDMTLTEVAPMSQGALNETNLKELQAEFDKIK
jgi:para-nitrobenzyl esterase